MTANDAASAQYNPRLLQQVIDDVLANSRQLLDLVLDASRLSLKAKEDLARTGGELHALMQARQQLTRLSSIMSDRYPAALRAVLNQAIDTAPSTRSLFAVQFNELELMDETQISESVERVRAVQALTSAVEAPLADLDAMMGAIQGLPQVQPEQNPLRPTNFLQALQDVVSQMQPTPAMRNDWMAHIAPALGNELRKLYRSLCERLQRSGVQPLGYAVRQPDGRYAYLPPRASGAVPGFGTDPQAQPDGPESQSGRVESMLTLDRLRRLLTGELADAPAAPPAPAAPASDRLSFAEQFARDFESGDTFNPPELPAADFDITVPAALEALQEMKQVDQMMERLGNQGTHQGASASTEYAALCRQPGGLAKALSMEVVALMVDNMARDSRLPWPVQQFIRTLEPALQQLALADPRFFNDKEHPARRLLQEITSRSLAFDGPQAPGFQEFMQSLLDTAGPLANENIDGPDAFGHALQQLQAACAAREQGPMREQARAIEALQHAEQRNLLAARLSRDLQQLPQIDKVPPEIARFVLAPWTQVMAQARLADQTGSADPGRYREVADALLWSVQPALTRPNPARLARLVPKLLPRLRAGLASIDYPAEQADAFFDRLMQLHQEVFKFAPELAPNLAPAQAPAASRAAMRPDDEPWVAPGEARQSGFMDITPGAQAVGSTPTAPAASARPAPTAATLTVGTWVNLQVDGEWERAQLSWIGQRGKLFLFTSASGRTQSMTLRLLEQLMQQGALQVLTRPTVVDEALNAVAQAAMRNSVDSQL